MRHGSATALVDHLHARDQIGSRSPSQAALPAGLPAGPNAQLMPASRLLPDSPAAAEDELAAFFETGLPPGSLHEVRCAQSRDAGALTGFVFALLGRMNTRASKPVLWISAPFADTANMTLFPQGLTELGFNPQRLVMVTPLSVKHALWAADEAARCTDLAAVILHVQGHPKALDMTATRRLNLRAGDSGTPVVVLRQSSEEEAGAAATRWCVSPRRSGRAQPHLQALSGDPIGHTALVVHLERNRQGATGSASITWNHQIRKFNHVRIQTTDHAGPPAALPQHRSSGPCDRPDQPPALGQVVALQTALERPG